MKRKNCILLSLVTVGAICISSNKVVNAESFRYPSSSNSSNVNVENNNLKVSNISRNSLFLSWDFSNKEDVVSYNIYQDDELLVSLPNFTSNYYVYNLIPGQEYNYKVVGLTMSNDMLTEEDLDLVISAETQAITLPSAPENLKNSTNDTEITLTWSSGNNGTAIVGYDIYQDNKLIDSIEGDVRTYSLPDNLKYNETTKFSVAAKTSQWTSSHSNYSEFTPVAPSFGFSVVQANTSTIDLAWETPNYGNRGTVQGYVIYFNGTETEIPSADINQYAFTDISPNNSNTVSIRPIIESGIISRQTALSHTLKTVNPSDITNNNKIISPVSDLKLSIGNNDISYGTKNDYKLFDFIYDSNMQAFKIQNKATKKYMTMNLSGEIVYSSVVTDQNSYWILDRQFIYDSSGITGNHSIYTIKNYRYADKYLTCKLIYPAAGNTLAKYELVAEPFSIDSRKQWILFDE